MPPSGCTTLKFSRRAHRQQHSSINLITCSAPFGLQISWWPFGREDDRLEWLEMTDYLPFDDNTQLARKIDRYPLSFTRNPSAPLIERPLTLSEKTGPTGLVRRLDAGPPDVSR